MKTKEMIELNNKLRKQLRQHNKKQYEDFLLYVRASNLSERQTEELLLETSQHLVEAQEQGKTYEEVFGQDVQGYAEEVVSSLPKDDWKVTWVDVIGYGFLAVAWGLVVVPGIRLLGNWFPELADEKQELSLLPFVLIFLISYTVAIVVLKFIKSTIFQSKWWIAAGALFWGLVIGFITFMGIMFEDFLVIQINSWMVLLLAGICFVLFMLLRMVSVKIE